MTFPTPHRGPPCFSVRRTAALTRWNIILLSRNRVAFSYASVFPLVPLALLFTDDRGDESLGASTITAGFLVASLVTIYYTVLSLRFTQPAAAPIEVPNAGELANAERVVGVPGPAGPADPVEGRAAGADRARAPGLPSRPL